MFVLWWLHLDSQFKMYSSHISLTMLHVVKYVMPLVVCLWCTSCLNIKIKLCDSACSRTEINSNWVYASPSSHLRLQTVQALRWSLTKFNHQWCIICGLTAQFGFSTRGSHYVSQPQEVMSHITHDRSGINVIIILIFCLFHLPFSISIIIVHSLSWQGTVIIYGPGINTTVDGSKWVTCWGSEYLLGNYGRRKEGNEEGKLKPHMASITENSECDILEFLPQSYYRISSTAE